LRVTKIEEALSPWLRTCITVLVSVLGVTSDVKRATASEAEKIYADMPCIVYGLAR